LGFPAKAGVISGCRGRASHHSQDAARSWSRVTPGCVEQPVNWGRLWGCILQRGVRRRSDGICHCRGRADLGKGAAWRELRGGEGNAGAGQGPWLRPSHPRDPGHPAPRDGSAGCAWPVPGARGGRWGAAAVGAGVSQRALHRAERE